MLDNRLLPLETLAGLALQYSGGHRWMRRGQLPILMYHSVRADDVDDAPCLSLAGMRVRESRFRQHMRYLAEHYQAVTLSDYVRWRRAEVTLPDNACVITFDDGYADTYTRAVPILRELGLKATIFVIGSCVIEGSGSPSAGPWVHRLYANLDGHPAACGRFFAQRFSTCPKPGKDPRRALRRWARRQLAELGARTRGQLLDDLESEVDAAPSAAYAFLSKDQLSQLSEEGFEIGAHSMSHDYMSHLSDAQVRDEVVASRKLIDGFLGPNEATFCYPFGGSDSFDARTTRALGLCGFSCSVSTIEGLNDRSTDPYALRRIRVTGDLPLSALVLRMTGVRAAAWKLRDLLRRAA